MSLHIGAIVNAVITYHHIGKCFRDWSAICKASKNELSNVLQNSYRADINPMVDSLLAMYGVFFVYVYNINPYEREC